MITLSITESKFFVKEKVEFLEFEAAPKYIWNSNLTMFQVAWIAISLGFVIEVLLVLAATIFFEAETFKPFIADLAQKVSWSVIVCVGLAVGRTLAQERENFCGLMGFFSAPAGFFIANFLHQSVAQALALTPGGNSGVPLTLIALIKAVEYGSLGLLLEWLEKRPRKTLGAYLNVGLFVGVCFGSMILFAIIQTANHPLTSAEYLSKAINEIIFPVGCSLVIYTSKSMGRIKVF